MKSTALFLLFFSSLYSLGQNYSINSKLLKSGNIEMDSIEVQISVYEDKIETESNFEKSKCKLSVTYSKTGKFYNEIRTSEKNTIYEYCYRIHLFYFENGKATNGEEQYYINQSMNEIPGLFEEVKNSYNKALNSEFLKKYVMELFEKIKTYR